MQFIVLAAIVPDAQEENVMKIAKEAGAGSATILHGKTIGLKEKKVFFGLTLEENVSILLFILPKRISVITFKRLKEELKPGEEEDAQNGMVFTFPLTHLSGLNIDEIDFFEEEIKNEL